MYRVRIDEEDELRISVNNRVISSEIAKIVPFGSITFSVLTVPRRITPTPSKAGRSRVPAEQR
jgi:hypothetical protein